jgi:hypothetical protein
MSDVSQPWEKDREGKGTKGMLWISMSKQREE